MTVRNALKKLKNCINMYLKRLGTCLDVNEVLTNFPTMSKHGISNDC